MAKNKIGRSSWVKPASAPHSEINVTPLVDVVLVLLIIFMVLTPLLEKDIEVRVPETVVEENPPPDPNDTQIVVQIAESGDYSINTEKIAPADYVTRLTQMLNTKRKDERVVFFMADDKASYGKLVAALDGAKAAGAEVPGFAPEVPEGAIVPAPHPTAVGAESFVETWKPGYRVPHGSLEPHDSPPGHLGRTTTPDTPPCPRLGARTGRCEHARLRGIRREARGGSELRRPGPGRHRL